MAVILGCDPGLWSWAWSWAWSWKAGFWGLQGVYHYSWL